MKRLPLRILLVAILAIAAAGATPALAREARPMSSAAIPAWQPQTEGSGAANSDDGSIDRALWALLGVGIGAAAGGGLYLLKRALGGFPKNPAWTAPISIMRSKDSPESYGEAPADAHGSHH